MHVAAQAVNSNRRRHEPQKFKIAVRSIQDKPHTCSPMDANKSFFFACEHNAACCGVSPHTALVVINLQIILDFYLIAVACLHADCQLAGRYVHICFY